MLLSGIWIAAQLSGQDPGIGTWFFLQHHFQDLGGFLLVARFESIRTSVKFAIDYPLT